MKNTAVLKFGGSSVANNENLNIVAKKVIDFKQKFKNVIVVVSAQGKTTDKLVKEAVTLSDVPNKREYDALISVGEQISASKLAILLNEKGVPAISLTGWQAGITTTNNYSKATISSINPEKIIKELEQGKVVVVTGFQGIDKDKNITTLGRGGSDTSAVAIASALKADDCEIFSDVEGIFTADPNKVKDAYKLKQIDYDEMLELSYEGAKVLHTRCIEIGKKFNVPISAESTFSSNSGTLINDVKIEENTVKSLVKNDNLIIVKIFSNDFFNIMNMLFENDVIINNLKKSEDFISFTTNKVNFNLINKIFKEFNIEVKNVSKIAIVGQGIANSVRPLNNALKTLNSDFDNIYSIDINQSKIVIIFNKIMDDKILENLHKKMF